MTRPSFSGSFMSVTIAADHAGERAVGTRRSPPAARPYSERSEALLTTNERGVAEVGRELVPGAVTACSCPSNGLPTPTSVTAVPARSAGLPRTCPRARRSRRPDASASDFAGGVDLRLLVACEHGVDVARAVELLGQLTRGRCRRASRSPWRPRRRRRPWLLLRHVPAAHLDLGDLVGAGHGGAQRDQVDAALEHERVLPGPALPPGASLAAVGRREVELAVDHRDHGAGLGASRRRNSQSLTPSCVTCSSTGPPASILPGRRPARCATFRAMSEAVMLT